MESCGHVLARGPTGQGPGPGPCRGLPHWSGPSLASWVPAHQGSNRGCAGWQSHAWPSPLDSPSPILSPLPSAPLLPVAGCSREKPQGLGRQTGRTGKRPWPLCPQIALERGTGFGPPTRAMSPPPTCQQVPNADKPAVQGLGQLSLPGLLWSLHPVWRPSGTT